MPTKIELIVEDDLSKQEVDDLQYLLTDAIGEFADRRSPAELYVLKRYAREEKDGVVVYTFGPKGTLDKIEQVRRRVALAKKLHNATLHPKATNIGPGLSEATLAEMAEADSRADACVMFLQDVFGMSSEEARGCFNQLEDKRVARLMVEQGLSTS